MDIFSDPVLLARVQFALTAAYHFFFVPLTIGLGLILAINETKYYRSRNEKDAAASRFWVKIFTATFVIGVATGITMEFSFGTNWADYSRFVGDIFGAPLAAEALLAFFLESVFLGILLFGRKTVSPKFYLVSAWLVWFGSCLSALWILIANSWMQTSLMARYSHVVVALLIMGAFAAMAVSAWYLIKGRHADFAMKTMRIGAVVGIVTSCVMIFTAHASAVVVAEEQPTKLAMMEGMYDDEVPPLYLFGWVVEESQQVITPFSIPGGTSFLATGTWDTEYQGLNSLAETEQYGALDPETAPVNFVFQTYHIMVAMYGLIMITAILAIVFTYRKGGRIKNMKWLQRLVLISPVFPVIAIQTGWFTAELGRQPWVVYPSATGPEGVALATGDAASASVSAPELLITMALFFLVYVFLIFAWARVMGRFIKEGPVVAPAEADDAASDEAKRKDAVPGFAPVDDPAVAAKGGE